MEVFEEELEQYFDQFKDLAETYPIFHGKQTNEDMIDEDKALGHFKVKVSSYSSQLVTD